MPHKITVKTNGQTLTVNASVSHWTSEALALAASSSNDVESTTTTTIYADYDLWFANTATEATITVKQLDGTTLLAQAFPVTPGHGNRTLNPLPTLDKIATDVGRRNGLRRPGVIAETMPRAGVPVANASHLSSGRMSMVAIDLTKGDVISSITFHSATTAAGTPTAQWFALYDKDLALLRQTADDTNTAWAANSEKTLSFASPFTVTYSGLHYLGINVTAGTVPTLWCVVSTSQITGLEPKLVGTSTGSLTTTAPDPAAAITAGSNYIYAYVS